MICHIMRTPAFYLSKLLKMPKKKKYLVMKIFNIERSKIIFGSRKYFKFMIRRDSVKYNLVYKKRTSKHKTRTFL